MLFADSYNIPQVVPLEIENLCCFITDLHENNIAPSTITSIVSGLSYLHKIRNVYDPTHAFAVRQLLTSLTKKFSIPDNRCPVSENLLFRLIDHIPNLTTLRYTQILLNSILLFAFNFALRIGEYTDSQHNLQLNDLKANVAEVSIHFKSYKHCDNSSEIHIVKSSNHKHCTVKMINEYLKLRGNKEGPLFLLEGKPITKSFFSAQLKQLLKITGLSEKITPHSLRIGSATHWSQLGYSECQIMKRGRWRSNAFLKYIRGVVDHTPK